MNADTHFKEAKILAPTGQGLSPLIESQAQAFYVRHGDIRLRVLLAQHKGKASRGTIIMFPGRTEFIEKYFETIEDFLNRHFTVLILDPRGQGLSDRLLDDRIKSYVVDFQDYANDLAYVIETFQDQLPKPHILMGHSMGGCVILQSVLSGVTSPSAVICCAPMLGLFDVETSITGYFIRFAAKLGFGKANIPFQKQDGGMPVPFRGNKLTSDKGRFERWAAYFKTIPRLRVGPPTLGWAAAAMRAMEYVNRNAAQLKIPGLIIAAGGDPIVDPTSNHAFSQAAGIDYQVIPGSLHELYMEKDSYRDIFLDAIDAFLKRQAL